MRWRTSLLLLVLGLAPGWWWAWREHAQVEAAGFTARKLAFVEEENRRLSNLLASQQQAAGEAAEANYRTQIEKSVTTLRELPFQQAVTYREIPRSELPTVLRQKLAQQLPDGEIENNGVALAALGLLPPGTDLKKMYLGLLGEQVGAFYDQHTQELVTFSGQSLSNSQNRVILAHELTHALEDQHFHLANLPLETRGNDDRALAASALVEGDATLVMNRYLLGNLSASVLKDSLAGALTTDVRQLAAAPRFLRETLLFPYLRGQEFCQKLYDHGGWQALADAFAHPPGSTSQILHPERFLSQPRQEPTPVKFGETTVAGLRPSSDNVLGEFGIRQLLANWFGDPAEAARLAAGWAGDRYLVYGDARTNSYLWRTLWSSDEAASGFAEAARAGWAKRPGITPELTRSLHEAVSFRLPNGREMTIIRRGRAVTLIEAQDAAWSRDLNQLDERSSDATDH